MLEVCIRFKAGKIIGVLASRIWNCLFFSSMRSCLRLVIINVFP